MTKEQEALSVLMDGELSPRRAAAVVDRLCGDPELAEAWVRMHRVRQLLDTGSSPVDVRAAVAMRLAQVDKPEAVAGLRGWLAGHLARLVDGGASLLRPAPVLALAGLVVVSVVALWPGEAPQQPAPRVAQSTTQDGPPQIDAPTNGELAAIGDGNPGQQEFARATVGNSQRNLVVPEPENQPYRIPPGKYEEYLARHEMAAAAGPIPRVIIRHARVVDFAQ